MTGPGQALALLGATTMIAEILWARELGVVLGSDLEGISIAVGLFLLGAAVGSWVSARTRVPVRLWTLAALSLGVPVHLWVTLLVPQVSDGYPYSVTLSPA